MADPAETSIGLALGGGGARGLAHISVIEVLDELGLKPRRVAGTSIGALIGAAYASGMSGAEIRAHTLKVLRDPAHVLSKLMELRPRRLKEVFAGGVLNAAQLDAERVLDIFAPDALAQDFGGLAIPLSIIAADFYGWSESEITEGPLRPAVACSIALPPIFRPVLYNGRVMADGGMVNPLPVDKLAGCDIAIAVDVIGGPQPRKGREIPSPMDAVFGTIQILMQSITATKLRQDKPDILMRPPINAYRVLDFLKAREILKAGDGIKDELKRKLEQVLND